MQDPFPILEDLSLWSDYDTMPVIFPDSFLGGAAPRLQNFFLHGILFPAPALPNLLLSATDLVSIWLFHIWGTFLLKRWSLASLG